MAKPAEDGPWPAPSLIASAVMQPDPLARHSWVWLDEGWTRCLRGRLTADTIALAERWRALDRPFVVASPGAHDGEDDLRLGLALPDKRRIGLHLPQAAVVRSAPPPSLPEVVAQAPTAWRSRLRKVETMARAAGVSTAVYGSLAWEYRCSTAYVRADSDVDLLFDAKAAPPLGPVLDLARALSADAGAPRLDGELILPGDRAIAWREFARRPEELLVKSAGGPTLCTRLSIEALFARAAA
jgi:phosphoribosyl-dephospho-CoA transferase